MVVGSGAVLWDWVVKGGRPFWLITGPGIFTQYLLYSATTLTLWNVGIHKRQVNVCVFAIGPTLRSHEGSVQCYTVYRLIDQPTKTEHNPERLQERSRWRPPPSSWCRCCGSRPSPRQRPSFLFSERTL